MNALTGGSSPGWPQPMTPEEEKEYFERYKANEDEKRIQRKLERKRMQQNKLEKQKEIE